MIRFTYFAISQWRINNSKFWGNSPWSILNNVFIAWIKFLEKFLFFNNSLTWYTHLAVLWSKRNRAVGLLAKVRHYTPKFLLKTIYYSLFSYSLICTCQIWGQIKIKSLCLKKLRVCCRICTDTYVKNSIEHQSPHHRSSFTSFILLLLG